MVATARWRRLAHRWLVAIAVAASVPSALGFNLGLPNKTDSLKFAVIGNFGTGDQPSYEVAAQMAALRARFPFEMVITTGDNIIGDQDDPSDLAEKFERPFRPLLDAGVRFYASLGNHDKQANRLYPPFNMNGQRYYTFVKKNVRFFVPKGSRGSTCEGYRSTQSKAGTRGLSAHGLLGASQTRGRECRAPCA